MLTFYRKTYKRAAKGAEHLNPFEIGVLYPRTDGAVATNGNGAGMTYVIVEPCIGVKDASCVDVCPVDCIHATDDDAMYFIDPDECIDCGACEPECPVTAIFAEDAVPEQWTNFIQINADYFANK